MAEKRSIRVGIISSDKVNSLSWLAQVFYHRLLLIVDDMGLYEADPDLLHSFLFPKNKGKVSVTDVAQLLLDCKNAGLIRTYEANDKRYLEVKKFWQKMPYGNKNKFPLPPPEDKISISKEEVEVEVKPRETARKETHEPVLKNNAIQEIQNKISDWKKRTIESEEWVQQTSNHTGKPIQQVKEFCSRFISKKCLSGDIALYTVQKLTNFMLNDLEKQNVQTYALNGNPPKKFKEFNPSEYQHSEKDKQEAKRFWWQSKIKEQATYKTTGKLFIAGSLITMENFEDAGILVMSADEKESWKQKARDLITKKGVNGHELRGSSLEEYRKIKLLADCIKSGNLSAIQDKEIIIMAVNMAIEDFYNKKTVEEFTEIINGVLQTELTSRSKKG